MINQIIIASTNNWRVKDQQNLIFYSLNCKKGKKGSGCIVLSALFKSNLKSYSLISSGTINTFQIFRRNVNAQKMKFPIKHFFSKCDQIRSFLRKTSLFVQCVKYISPQTIAKWKSLLTFIFLKKYSLQF